MGGPQNSLHCTGPTFPVLPWYQHPPWPVLALFRSSPPSLCALSPLMPQKLPPTPRRDLALLLTSPSLHSWRGEKKRGQCQRGKNMPPGTAPHLPVGQGLTRGNQGGCGGLQSAMVPSIPAAPSGHRAWAPTAPLNVAAPRASLLLPRAGRAGPQAERGPTLAGSVARSSPCHDFSSPKFPWELSPCLQPAQPPAAGGSERRQGHRWGPWAYCGQGTARLSTTSRTHHVQPRHGSWESQGMEQGGVGQAGRKAGWGHTGHGGAANPGSPGGCNPGAEGWRAWGRGWGTPSKPAAPQGQDVALSSWKSNWKRLTTLRGQRLCWQWGCQSEGPGGMGKGPQRAGGQPQGAGGHGHMSKHCTLVATTPTAQHTAFCAASSRAPIWGPQHKKWCKAGQVRWQTPEPGWGLQPCHASRAPSSKVGSHALSAAQRGVMEQAEPGSSPKHLHPQRLKVPSHLPGPPPSRVTLGSAPRAAMGHMKGRVCSALWGPQTQRGRRVRVAPHL